MTETSMTVGTLRAALADLPDDLPVILSSDEEGNDFNHLWQVETSKYAVDDDGYGDEGGPVHPDDLDDYNADELIDVVVLWP